MNEPKEAHTDKTPTAAQHCAHMPTLQFAQLIFLGKMVKFVDLANFLRLNVDLAK